MRDFKESLKNGLLGLLFSGISYFVAILLLGFFNLGDEYHLISGAYIISVLLASFIYCFLMDNLASIGDIAGEIFYILFFLLTTAFSIYTIYHKNFSVTNGQSFFFMIIISAQLNMIFYGYIGLNHLEDDEFKVKFLVSPICCLVTLLITALCYKINWDHYVVGIILTVLNTLLILYVIVCVQTPYGVDRTNNLASKFKEMFMKRNNTNRKYKREVRRDSREAQKELNKELREDNKKFNEEYKKRVAAIYNHSTIKKSTQNVNPAVVTASLSDTARSIARGYNYKWINNGVQIKSVSGDASGATIYFTISYTTDGNYSYSDVNFALKQFAHRLESEVERTAEYDCRVECSF